MNSAINFVKIFILTFPFLLQILDWREQSRFPAQVILDLDGDPVNEDVTAYGWKLVFHDDFLEKDKAIASGTPKDCFDGPVACLYHGWIRKDCLTEHLHDGLKDLNRCNWTVWGMYNWMDWDAKEGKGINSFHPKQVAVKDGALHLSAVRSQIPMDQLKCKVAYNNPEYNHEKMFFTDCLINSGGVQSSKYFRQTNNREVGFSQEYGRFEVRAKLSHGTGSWPAAWMLPSVHPLPEAYDTDNDNGCGWWPYRGEIDLVEAWEDTPDKVTVSYHDGDCSLRVKSNSNRQIKSKELFPEMKKNEREKTFYQDFHTYAVEWSENAISFYIDDIFVHAIAKGKRIKAKHFETEKHNEWADDIQAQIARGDFYFLLNNTIQAKEEVFDFWKSLDYGSEAEADNVYIIDYVKAYKRCTIYDESSTCYKPNYKNKNIYHGKNQEIVMDLNVYPNPISSNNNLNIRLTSPEDCDKIELQLLDINGRISTIQTFKNVLTDQNYFEAYNIGNRSPGFYFVSSLYQGCGEEKENGQSTVKIQVIL
jgi:hypothetical protein